MYGILILTWHNLNFCLAFPIVELAMKPNFGFAGKEEMGAFPATILMVKFSNI